MKTLFIKFLKDTVLANLVIALLREGASRTTTPYDDYVVDIVEHLIKGGVVKDIVDKDSD